MIASYICDLCGVTLAPNDRYTARFNGVDGPEDGDACWTCVTMQAGENGTTPLGETREEVMYGTGPYTQEDRAPWDDDIDCDDEGDF